MFLHYHYSIVSTGMPTITLSVNGVVRWTFVVDEKSIVIVSDGAEAVCSCLRIDAKGSSRLLRSRAPTMSLSTFLLRAPRAHCTAGLSHSLSKSHQTFFLVTRKYAAHREPSLSSTLSQSLDQTQRSGPKHDRVGPFQLGLAQRSLPQSEKVQKWSELSTGGKGTSFS